jgi:carboxymethylenebutenolidase
MGHWINLKAEDGHELQAWEAKPIGQKPLGAIIVLQEIFGVNHHIKWVTDDYAVDGYVAIAPALFDRTKKGVELGYGENDWPIALQMKSSVPWDAAVKDIAAAVAYGRQFGRVGVVGYCWGGSLAWLAATRLQVDAVSAYYGGQMAQFKDEMPHCAVIAHFGEKDSHIPMSDVHAIEAKHPDMSVFTYPAGHGFNCEERADFDRVSAKLARERTRSFFFAKLVEHAK